MNKEPGIGEGAVGGMRLRGGTREAGAQDTLRREAVFVRNASRRSGFETAVLTYAALTAP
jgi:hypothetical protein